VDWTDFDLVVIRSTWDYALRRDEFVAWAQRVESVTTLRNPASVIRWNTDKRYLADLATDGVAVTPTEFLLPADVDGAAAAAVRIRSAIAPDSQFVVKPTVSAGSKDTVRYAAPVDDRSSLDSAATQAAALLAAGRAVMVQPYLSAVDAEDATPIGGLDRRGVWTVENDGPAAPNEEAIRSLRASGQVAYAAPLFSSNGETVAIIPEIVVRMKPGIEKEEVERLSKATGCTIRKRMEFTEQEYLLEVLGPDA